MKKPLKISLVIVAILGVAFLILTSSQSDWDGRVSRPIKVTVKSTDGGVIKDATVSLIQGMDYFIRDGFIKDGASPQKFEDDLQKRQHRFVSDSKGNGVLVGQFGAGGGKGLLGKTGRFTISGDLVVSHSDHIGFTVPLVNFTGESRFSISESELPITVFMNPKRTEQAAAPNGP